MNDKADRIAERQGAVLEKGAADMWRIALADTVLMMLDEGLEITRESLRVRIEAQFDACENKFARAKLKGTLNVLNGRPPRD